MCCLGEAEIQVRVTDMNDNAPFFRERFYMARVPENTDIGTIVMTVTAEDLDEGLQSFLALTMSLNNQFYLKIYFRMLLFSTLRFILLLWCIASHYS